MKCPTRLLLSSVFAVSLPSSLASAQVPNCIQDVWQAHGNAQSLSCTANDITLASVSGICVDDGAGGCVVPSSCIEGLPVTLTADFTMSLTAQTRYDLGLYIATDGGGGDGAVTGQCADNVVTSANSVTFFNEDAAPDVCGDIAAPLYTPQVIHQTITVQCTDGNGDGTLNLPWCTSWRQPGSNEICDSAVFTTPALFDAYPGSPSKCNCGALDIGITVETPQIQVTKTALSLTLPETGGAMTYVVTVENLAQVVSLDVDQLVDNLYGDLTFIHDQITATDCSLGTILPGDTYECEFTVFMPAGQAGDSVTDVVMGCAGDVCDADDATVLYTDVSNAPSLVKTAVAVAAVVVDVAFDVTIYNNSPVDILTINDLQDDVFGDIATVQGDVVTTLCSSGVAILPGDAYECSFVGRIHTTGLHVDVVTALATDDDGIVYGPQDSAFVNVSVTFP